jgi:hypothetical protein
MSRVVRTARFPIQADSAFGSAVTRYQSVAEDHDFAGAGFNRPPTELATQFLTVDSVLRRQGVNSASRVEAFRRAPGFRPSWVGNVSLVDSRSFTWSRKGL